MPQVLMPLLRQAAALARRAFCTMPMRLAVIVAIVAASASASHAAAPLEVRVDGAGPQVLSIPGLAGHFSVADALKEFESTPGTFIE